MRAGRTDPPSDPLVELLECFEAPGSQPGAVEADVGVTFDVGLEALPEGAALEVRFAKTADAFLDDAGSVFQLAAQRVYGTGRGSLDDAIEDVAFVVQVTRVGIENTDLGDNTVDGDQP